MTIREKSVLVVGGGIFGTSTAYELNQRGYKNVRVFDRCPPPSSISAGTDLNKIIRVEYAEPIYAKMASDSLKRWQDPNGFFHDLYSHTGWLLSTSEGNTEYIEESIDVAAGMGLERATPMAPEQVREKWPMFTGTLPNWQSWYNSTAGWVNSREALLRMARMAASSGVEYVTGVMGYVLKLLYDERGTCIGVKCQDGSSHFADVVILAAGAYSPALLDMKGQIEATGHAVGHIQLTPTEAEKYRKMPIVNNLQAGLLFPPQADNIMKVAPSHFVTNYAAGGGAVSLPRYRLDHPTDRLPSPIVTRLRNFVQDIIPEVADRAWVETNLCWDADTPDYHLLIDSHPEHQGLYIATGGSSHSFKFFPVLGAYIVDMLEGKLDPQVQSQWKWRPGITLPHGAADPHPTPLIDLQDIEDFGQPRARL